jgi:hypothetical protein
MNILSKMKRFSSYSLPQQKILIEAYGYLAWGRFMKWLPFAKIVPSLGQQMKETSYSGKPENKEVLQYVSDAIHIMSGYTFWESQCLVKAIAGMKMLEKRGIESTLYLGTAKDEKGGLIAHAWLRSGSFYISGLEGMEKFTVIAKFAKEIGNKRKS